MEKLGYKHLETDAEFIARVRKDHPGWYPYKRGEALDDEVWNVWMMERKILEVFP